MRPSSSRNLRSHRLRAGIAAWLLTVFAACQSPVPQPATPTTSEGGTFRMVMQSPDGLDPARMDDSYEAAIINQVFDGLLDYDVNLNTVPCIANSWEVSRDGRVYRFQLKKGVRFHDGSELTSDDVLFSFHRVFTLPLAESTLARDYLGWIQGTEEYASGAADHIEGLRAAGAYEVEITLSQPYTSFLAVMATEMARIVPADYVKRVGDDAFSRRPIGTGPFRLVEWKPEKRIVLSAFKEYHLGRAHLDSLVFNIPTTANESDYAADRFLAGDLSAVIVPTERLEEFQQRPEVRLHQRPELSLTYLAFDTRTVPFADARVRRAFTLAVDRRKVPQLVGAGRERPSGILPAGMPGYQPGDKLPEYDPDLARELLEQAGYPSGEGLPVIVHGCRIGSATDLRMYEAIGDQVAEVGFRFMVRPLEWADFLDGVRAQEFNTYALTWVADLPDPDSFLFPLFHSKGASNYNGYSNPDLDKRLEKASREKNGEKRWQQYRRAEKKILEDLPVMPLHYNTTIFAVREDYRGFALSPVGQGNLAMEDVSSRRVLREAR